MNIEPNYISRLGFVCLFNLMLLISIDGYPLITPASDQAEAESGQKMGLPQQIFAGLEKSAAVSDSKAISKGNSLHRLLPRAADDKKDEDRVLELTVSVPQLKMDALGQMDYNPWGVIFGKVGQDKRFNRQRVKSENIMVASDPPKDYYPYTGIPETVCMSRSTVYNTPRIRKWLPHHMYKYAHYQIFLKLELRRTLYTEGNPEECHTAFYSKFRNYQECAMRRNQRMESLIPKYPRHQKPSA